ncbi:hypothetical protein CH256_14450 [Rhodococcus sp. 05-2254-6]|nr:hypothetical protein A2J02_20715 [Rhodococcus sp. EPR-147]KZF09911.1 hypothetical protein A2J04_21270 [Rhodococcus sp. EPR-279]OZE30408.1 hypothetical protein CH256_14450 [Rhodococcus sp. 05-2254-6]OZE32923.1 hypothetical protein CH259_21000 [Rhodococcus sp. 05-2254-4]OZE44183.1 hypothetical protein CH261_17655 [Rhodococcus sp. 05-2254-3]OZE56137.1 hypothetical protein CH283_01265 [Rhodococcus sp. 05-2254-2]OZF46704.1 hypothetical protein CH291_14180 [Rhodococcus sp. 14-1411-2a]
MLGCVIAAGITPSAAVPPTTATHVGAAAGKPPVRYTMRSTPARLVAMGTALVFLALTVGNLASTAVTDRVDTLGTLLVRTEPFANSAQNLYGALSVADAAAATAFIAGGLEPPEVRERYSQALGEASSELIAASAGVAENDAATSAVLTQIAAGLPVYSGLVETARANNRSGNPVGAAYLGEASTMMQTTLLPLAEKLYTEQASRVSADQERFTSPPLFAIGSLVFLLLMTGVAQWYLSRTTRRTLNVGFLAATVAVAGLLGWMLVVGLISSIATDRAIDRGVSPLKSYTTGFILAQQARADETLDLARRGGGQDYGQSFDANVSRLTEMFQGDTAVIDALNTWSVSHSRIDSALEVGDFNGAVSIATGTGESDSAAAFTALDSVLVDGIENARSELRSNIDRSVWVLSGLSNGAYVLTVVASVAFGVGLFPRLREYL